MVSVLGEFIENALKNAATVPCGKPIEDRLPGPKTFWQITPRSAGFRNIEDSIHEGTGVELGGLSTSSAMPRK
jgi:hypothetical protein